MSDVFDDTPAHGYGDSEWDRLDDLAKALVFAAQERAISRAYTELDAGKWQDRAKAEWLREYMAYCERRRRAYSDRSAGRVGKPGADGGR